MPERIQRKRAKGWRMPTGAVYVGRPSRWGNPFRVVSYSESRAAGIGDVSVIMARFHNGRENVWATKDAVDNYRRWVTYGLQTYQYGCRPHGPLAPVSQGPTWNQACVSPSDWQALYRAPFTTEEIRTNLAGADLACWCPLDQPCHADVLLELANP